MEVICKKKLMFIITQPVVGGAQKYVFDLARYFSRSDPYEVSVASGGPEDGDLFKKLSDRSIKTHYLKFLGREVKFWDDCLALVELLKLFKKEKPDIIHLNSSKIGILGSLAGFLVRTPKIVFTAHGWSFKEDLPRLTRCAVIFLEWLTAKFKDQIICVSQDDFDQALKYKIAPPRKLHLIYNSIFEKIKFLSRDQACQEISKIIGREFSCDTIALVNLGRLYVTKGLRYLIDAVAELKRRLPEKDIVLVIFGDGPEKENIKNQISNMKIEDAVFLAGDVENAAKYLIAFDALVISSVKEGMPYAILEAGLAGLPVVATNVGGVGEIITDNQNGILVQPKNSQALAEAIENLINNPSKTHKLSLALKRAVAKKFNFKEMVEKTEWVYKI